jgi:hypothetical protein
LREPSRLDVEDFLTGFIYLDGSIGLFYSNIQDRKRRLNQRKAVSDGKTGWGRVEAAILDGYKSFFL